MMHCSAPCKTRRSLPPRFLRPMSRARLLRPDPKACGSGRAFLARCSPRTCALDDKPGASASYWLCRPYTDFRPKPTGQDAVRHRRRFAAAGFSRPAALFLLLVAAAVGVVDIGLVVGVEDHRPILARRRLLALAPGNAPGRHRCGRAIPATYLRCAAARPLGALEQKTAARPRVRARPQEHGAGARLPNTAKPTAVPTNLSSRSAAARSPRSERGWRRWKPPSAMPRGSMNTTNVGVRWKAKAPMPPPCWP